MPGKRLKEGKSSESWDYCRIHTEQSRVEEEMV